MNWSEYTYLAAATVAALAVLLLLIRNMPELSKPTRHCTARELLFLGAIMAIALFVIYGNFYLRKSFFAYTIGDPGSDVIEQYVPFYSNLVGNVRDGSFSLVNYWSFEYELGVNAAGYQSWLYDPFNLILVPLGLLLGDAHLALILVVVHSLKAVISAYLFALFLTRYCDTPIARILGATLYALSGYMIVYGQHYWLGSAFAVFTLILLLFELFLERTSAPRFIALAVSIATMVAWTAYIAFMVLLFEAIYLLFRIPHYRNELNVKTYLLTVLQLVAPVACGMLVAGFSLIPYALFLLTETSRTSTSTSFAEQIISALTGFVNLDWIPVILSRAMGSSLITTGLTPMGDAISSSPTISFSVNYIYDFILLGYSCGTFILLSQFYHWVFTETSRSTKLLISGATLLVLLYCFNYFLPTVFTAMVRMQYRSCFMIAPLACAAMSIGFEKRLLPGKPARKPLAIAAVISFAVIGWSVHLARMGRFDCVYFAAALATAICAIVISTHKPSWRPALLATFVSLLVSSSAVDGFMVSNARIHVDGDYFPLSDRTDYAKKTETALDWLESYDPSFYRVEKTYLDWTPLNDSLIQHYAGVSAYNSTPDSDVDAFYHKLWSEAISPWAIYSQGYVYDPNQPAIMELLGVKYILSDKPLDYAWCAFVEEIEGVYIYQNNLTASIATLRQDVVSESATDALASSAERRELLRTSIIVPDEVAQNLDGADGAGSQPAPYSSTFFERGIGALEGTISCDADSIACLSIPYTGTWHIFVDGTEVETFKANYGFIGFALESGTHTVTATYELAGLSTGAICSAIGLVATALAAGAIAFHNHRARKDCHMTSLEA